MTNLKRLREVAKEIELDPFSHMVENMKYRGLIFEWFCLTKPETIIPLLDNINKLKDALEGLRYKQGCFCEVSIGNPMYSGHLQSCKNAKAALEGLE